MGIVQSLRHLLRPCSLMDRTSVSGAEGPGSIPGGAIFLLLFLEDDLG